MKTRNLRFNIKKNLIKNDDEEAVNDTGRQSYRENNNMSMNHNRAASSSEQFEIENKKTQSDAKDLIFKTKRIIEDMDGHKYKSPSRSKSPLMNNTRSMSPMNSSFEGDKTLIQSCSHRSPGIDILMSQRIVDHSKRIKELEREIKQKNLLIEKLQAKLDGRDQEVNRLNECLMKEKHSYLKLELIQLQKKLASQDKEMGDYKLKFEGMANDYNAKIKSLMNYNDSTTTKIKELETNLKQVDDVNVEIENSKKDLEVEYQDITDKYKEERVINTNLKDHNDKLVENLRILMKLIKNLYREGLDLRTDQRYLFDSIRIFSDGDTSSRKYI
jgi:hypothetical protein